MADFMRRLVDRLGWFGLAGVLSLLVALLLLATVAAPLAGQRRQLNSELAALRDRLRLNGNTGVPARDVSAAAQLRRFHAGFPTVPTAPEWIREINGAARRSGIVLAAGEYRLALRGDSALQRYVIVLPVRGSYGQIRSFVESALAAVPSAALDEIEMRREAATDVALDAKVRMTLYLRDTLP